MKLNTNSNVGTVLQIIGPVMDISFPAGKMPNIYNCCSKRFWSIDTGLS